MVGKCAKVGGGPLTCLNVFTGISKEYKAVLWSVLILMLVILRKFFYLKLSSVDRFRKARDGFVAPVSWRNN